MHANGDAQDGTERQHIGSDVAIGDGSVVGTPAVHDGIYILETIFLLIEARHKPRRGPSGIGTAVEDIMNLGGQFHRPALCKLQHGTEAFHHVHAHHRHRHAATTHEMARIATAAEVVAVGRHPAGCLQAGLHIGVGEFPVGFHRGITVFVGHRARGIERRGTAVNQVDEAASSHPFGTMARDTLHSIGTPIGANVREHHTTIGEQMTEKHRHAVEEVILCSEHISLARSVPVERRAEHRLGEVEVRLVVGPLALSLHTACDGVVAKRLLLISHLAQPLVAMHEVADDHHRLHGELPVLILLLTVLTLALAVKRGHRCAGEERTVFVVVVAFLRFAVFVDPLHRFLELLGIEDVEVHATQNLHQRHILRAHAEVVLQEVGVHDGAGNAHAGVAQRQIRLAAHRSNSLGGAGKAQYLLCYVGRNGVIVEVLHVVTVDAKGGQSLLGMCGEHGSQIDSTRALRTVKSPHSLRVVRVHVHRLRAVAPAGGHSDGTSHTLALELLGTGRTLCHTADGAVGNDALHRRAVAILEMGLNEILHCIGQSHGFHFQTLSHTALTTVDGRTYANLRIFHS